MHSTPPVQLDAAKIKTEIEGTKERMKNPSKEITKKKRGKQKKNKNKTEAEHSLFLQRILRQLPGTESSLNYWPILSSMNTDILKLKLQSKKSSPVSVWPSWTNNILSETPAVECRSLNSKLVTTFIRLNRLDWMNLGDGVSIHVLIWVGLGLVNSLK